MEALEEIHSTTRDEYGLKAYGLLQSLEKFSTVFGLKLSYHLFGASEQVSLALQKKNIAIVDAISAIQAAKKYFERIRSEEEFDRFYAKAEQFAEEHKTDKPVLLRRRRRPQRYNDGAEPHIFSSVKDHYRQLYFEACDLLYGELTSRFDTEHIALTLSMEQTLLKAANKNNFNEELKILEKSCFSADLDFSNLRRQLPLLHDIIKQGLPEVRLVTSVDTICSAMNKNNGVLKDMLPSVHKLLRLIPISSVTSERTFSTMKRINTYLRSSMTEKRLNNCLLLNAHKELTENLDLILIAKEFVEKLDERKRYFGNF